MIMFCSGISSCEMIKGWFDVEFETTLSGDLNINIQESEKKSINEYFFQSQGTLNPLDDEQIAEYKDHIRKITVTRITVEVNDLNMDSVVFMEGTTFSIVSGSNITEWTLGNDWTIVDSTKMRLVDLDGAYGQVEDMVESQEEFNVGVTGVSNESGASLTIRVSIVTKIAAESR